MARELKTIAEAGNGTVCDVIAGLTKEHPSRIGVELSPGMDAVYLSADQFRQFCLDGLEVCEAAKEFEEQLDG